MDALFPEVNGTLEERSPPDLIALVDEKKITGVLEAHDGPRRWEMILRGGEVVSSESTVEGDPISTFLELDKGKYRLRQQLQLPDETVSDRRVAEGDLSEEAPGKLIRSCEKGGLTGALRLLSDDRFAEVLFDAGVLTTITLDGHQDVDAGDLFRWTTGRWAILARPALQPPPSPDDSGIVFLREVEMALADLVGAGDDDTTARQSTKNKGVKKAKRRDDSVRVVYLDTVEPLEDTASEPSRYARKDLTAIQVFYGGDDQVAKPAKDDPDPVKEPECEGSDPSAGSIEEDAAEAAPERHSPSDDLVEGSWSAGEEAPEEGAEGRPDGESDAAEDAQAPTADAEDQGANESAPPSRESARKDQTSAPDPSWADTWWVWVLAGLGLALLIGLLHLTSPGAGN